MLYLKYEFAFQGELYVKCFEMRNQNQLQDIQVISIGLQFPLWGREVEEDAEPDVSGHIRVVGTPSVLEKEGSCGVRWFNELVK